MQFLRLMESLSNSRNWAKLPVYNDNTLSFVHEFCVDCVSNQSIDHNFRSRISFKNRRSEIKGLTEEVMEVEVYWPDQGDNSDGR